MYRFCKYVLFKEIMVLFVGELWDMDRMYFYGCICIRDFRINFVLLIIDYLKYYQWKIWKLIFQLCDFGKGNLYR